MFGKNRQDNASPAAKRDERKARRFFDHAQAVADARNYDYAIDCYINGLRHDPDNMPQHEALREVALKRKVAGGKAAGIADRIKKGGKDPVERMLHAEMLWAKDPLNITHMVEVMTQAVEADQADPSLHFSEVAYWVGTLVLEANKAAKKPSESIYVKVRDLFSKIDAFDKAAEACSLAIQLNPHDHDLLQSLKDLEAELTIQAGRYGEGFRSTVADEDKQRQLEQEASISKPASAVDEMVERHRAAFEEDPQDPDKLQKFVATLLQKDTDDAEDEAIELLEDAWTQTGQYRIKVQIGDIRMKRFNRQLRQLGKMTKENPQDETAKKQWRQIAKAKLRFELEEYSERVQNYPTDLSLRYELGKRLFAYSRHDEAIAAFQQAKADPRYRAACYEYLGRCYIAQEWYEEAIDTLREGIEIYPIKDDKLALDLRYRLMLALKKSAKVNQSVEQGTEAQKTASQILQNNINYRDIRQQIDEIKTLVDAIKKNPSPQA